MILVGLKHRFAKMGPGGASRNPEGDPPAAQCQTVQV